jgi:hypothetical protein
VPFPFFLSIASLSGSKVAFLSDEISLHTPNCPELLSGTPPDKVGENGSSLLKISIMIGDTTTSKAREIALIKLWVDGFTDFAPTRQNLISLDHGRSIGFLFDGKVYLFRNVL